MSSRQVGMATCLKNVKTQLKKDLRGVWRLRVGTWCVQPAQGLGKPVSRGLLSLPMPASCSRSQGLSDGLVAALAFSGVGTAERGEPPHVGAKHPITRTRNSLLK